MTMKQLNKKSFAYQKNSITFAAQFGDSILSFPVIGLKREYGVNPKL